MTAGRVSAGPLALAALTVAIAGCGPSAAARVPDLAGVPLASGAKIVAQDRQCDHGAHSYCAIEVVIVDPLYRSSTELMASEHQRLTVHGWSTTSADIVDERAAESPGHRLRVTYATAFGDLQGIDLGSIIRSRTIALALSRAMFDRAPAMSVMVEAGST